MSKNADLLVASLLHEGDVKEYLSLGAMGHLFSHSEWDAESHEWMDGFVRKYGKLPAPSTYCRELGRELPKHEENPAWYHARLFDQHIRVSLQKASAEAQDHILKNPEEALQLIAGCVRELEAQKSLSSLHDFREAWDTVRAELADKLKEGVIVMTGWPTFDDMNGGMRKGDLISLAGRAAVGKSYVLLSLCLHVWKKWGKKPLFVSMEMNAVLVFERLAAMEAEVPYDWLKAGAFPTLHSKSKDRFDSRMKALKDMEMPFWVVDSNMSSTVWDIRSLVERLEPDLVVVDGGYMLKSEDRRLGMYERVAVNVNLLKTEVAPLAPVVASWQFNRGAAKTNLKKGDRPGLEHIGYSDVIGQVSSVVLGMFEEEGTETSMKRRVDILKGRSGESGMFFLNWDFVKMDFSEIDENAIKTVIDVVT